MSLSDIVDRACIAGVGATPQGQLPGRNGDDLSVWAVREALVDAGIDKSEIDALIVQKSYGGQGELRAVGHRLGIEPASAFNAGYGGEALVIATLLAATGVAHVIALVYGTNQRTNRNPFTAPAYQVGGNYETVYGLANPGSAAAFNYRRRMHDFGATEAQLGAIAIAQSKAAARNPLAVYREELTLDSYLAAPYLIAPLRLYDFCMVSDGGFALIVVSRERAKDLARAPVWISGLGFQSSFLEIDHVNSMYHPSQIGNAHRLWSASEVRREDIDALYVQDAYTPNVLSALENYGFCQFGTAHEWIQGGRIELGGELPTNPNGGQNRMTYMVGWQNTYDAVKQLRNEAQDPGRQIAGCSAILCTYSAGHWQQTCSVILRK
jgi:acetyl-CoA acetyltransferase